MATPSANRQGRTPSQSQHGAAATPPVSTPFSATHAAFSPHGPRSSPQVKRSPATSSTLAAHSINIPVNFDSPSAVAALGNLGINGGLDLGLDDGMGGLTGSLGVLRRGDDDGERAKKMETILAILKKSTGLVSEQGLERLVKGIKTEHKNLEWLWEEGMGSDRKRTLVIAGDAFALEIVLSNNIVLSVALSFPGCSDMVMKHVDRAGQVFYDDLKLRADQSPLTKTLDKFATNLERLTSLDKLSVLPQLNLQEAIAGVFESLNRLFEWDVEKLREDPATGSKSQEALEMLAMCTRHGQPVMHTRGRLGLGLEYWKDYRLVPPTQDVTKQLASANEKVWAISIGCEPLGARVFQPVRVSDRWLPPEVEKLNPSEDDLLLASNGPILDWQEPENIILPANADSKAQQEQDQLSAALATPKLPEVIFKAAFEPKIPIPFSVWHQIYQLIGITPDSEFALTTFDSINFPVPPGSNNDPSEPRMIRCVKDVFVLDDKGKPAKIPHRNTLFIYKPVYGRTLEELPFSHPSQLIRMLPTLRQYAFLSTLLENSFNAKLEEIIRPEEQSLPNKMGNTVMRHKLSTFFDEPEPSPPKQETQPADGAVHLDIVLTAHPVPRLQIGFPFRGGMADIVLEIRLNGHVHVVSQNIVAEEDVDEVMAGPQETKKGKLSKAQDLGVLLEHCEDLGQWSEWIRHHCQ